MRVEALSYFLESVRCGSYSQASKQLYISEQGLSKAIGCLERELNVKLFSRNGRTLTLTKEGETVKNYAARMIETQQDMFSALARLSALEEAEQAERMPLVTMPYISNSIFNLLESMMKDYGLNHCVVQEENFPALSSKFQTEGVKNLTLVALLPNQFEMLPKMDDSVRFIPLFETQILLYLRRELMPDLRNSEVVTPEELSRIPLVHYNEHVLGSFVEEFMKGVPANSANPIQRSSNLANIMKAVNFGEAASFTDSFSWFAVRQRQESPLGDFLRLRTEPEFTVSLGFFIDTASPDFQKQLEYAKRYVYMLETGFRLYLKGSRVNPANLGSFRDQLLQIL